jgi:hypothetical protein
MKSTRLLFILIFAISIAMLSTSCSGGLFADGTVYEWIDAPIGSTGEIYVDAGAPASRIIKTVPGAFISFSHSERPVLSDNAGAFHESVRVAPGGPYMMNIRVEKEGYFSLAGEFQHGGRDGDGSKHRITFFMVRK